MNRILKIRTLKPLVAATLLSLPFVALPGQAEGDGKWRGGENVYEKVCGHCHEAGIGPQIKGRPLPPAYITAIVRHGFSAMPAFPASFIDDASLQAVGEYIQSSPAPLKQAPGAEQ